MFKQKINLVEIVIFVVVLGFMTANATILFKMQQKIKDQKQAVAEKAKPAELQLTTLNVPSCDECFSISPLIDKLKSDSSVKITKEDAFDYASSEAVELIKKYSIVKLPTLIVQGEISKKVDIQSLLQSIGASAQDGAIVVTKIPPPYLDASSGAVKGKFTVTYITDRSCKECYDPLIHRTALSNLGMRPVEEKMVDRSDSEGKKLIAQYAINSIPTILLTGDLVEYASFEQVWPTVGTIEKDGTRIFRAGEDLMGPYRDLKTGQVKNIKQEQAKAQDSNSKN